MTDGLDQALASVGITLLDNDPLLVVFDGVVPAPTPAPPYCVVYTTIDRPSEDPDNAGDGRTRVWVVRWIVNCIGGNAVAARAVVQQVRTQLLDVAPVVPGLTCGLIRWEASQPPARDEATGPVYMQAVEVFRLRATSS